VYSKKFKDYRRVITMKIVISIGGSVLVSDFNPERVRKFAIAIEKLAEGNKVFVIVGGGKIAREYISVARELGANETSCDYLGIDVTRLNAAILASAIKEAPRTIPVDLKEAHYLSEQYNVVIMGGTFPGHTTDATAALLAEFVGADLFLNATSVDGVYSADPRKDPNAFKIGKLTAKELVNIVSSSGVGAGSNNVLDLLAAKIVERSKIKTVVFLGTPENIIRTVKGDYDDIGTEIVP